MIEAPARKSNNCRIEKIHSLVRAEMTRNGHVPSIDAFCFWIVQVLIFASFKGI